MRVDTLITQLETIQQEYGEDAEIVLHGTRAGDIDPTVVIEVDDTGTFVKVLIY